MAFTLKDLYDQLTEVQDEINAYRVMESHKRKPEILVRILMETDLLLSMPPGNHHGIAGQIDWLTKQGCDEPLSTMIVQLKSLINVVAFHTDSFIRYIPPDVYVCIEHSLGIVNKTLKTVIEIPKPA